MTLRPKHQRLLLLLISAVAVGISAVALTTIFRSNLIYFYTPSDVLAQIPPAGKTLRLGGLVKEGSIHRRDANIDFVLTDLKHELRVTYSGTLPALFREGQ